MLDERAFERDLEFLRESNLIENIKNIDYTQESFRVSGQGHWGAYIASQQMARLRLPISIGILCRWHTMITQEQLQQGHEMPREGIGRLRGPELPINVRVGIYIPPRYEEVPRKIENFVVDLNRILNDTGRTEDSAVVEILGDAYQHFEAIHPFVDGNGRIGRILVNYLATWYGYPIIVFRASERTQFYEAHESKRRMRCFIGGKVMEAVTGFSGVLLRSGSIKYCQALYESADGHERRIVQWHEIFDAMERWKSEDEAK